MTSCPRGMYNGMGCLTLLAVCVVLWSLPALTRPQEAARDATPWPTIGAEAFSGLGIGDRPTSPPGARPGEESGDSLPADPFRRCAAKALAGHFGPLQPWQERGYRNGLREWRQVTVWQTCYYPSEGFRRGKATASGIGVSERVAAANKLPRGSYIWLPNPPHLRQVLDTGAKRNDTVARRRGAALWIDLWIPHLGWHGLRNDCYIRQVTVIPARVRSDGIGGQP